MKTIEDYIEITSLRHEMHVCRDFNEWIKMNDQIVDCISEIDPKNNIPRYSWEVAYCEREDCGMENCSHCEEAEREFLSDNKDEFNELIEKWLAEQEEKNELEGELAPTGEARMNWILSNMY